LGGEWILTKSEILFSGSPTPIEIKKNLLHIRKQQLFFMALIKRLRRVFYTPNRELLFLLTNKAMVFGLIGLLVLSLLPLRSILTVVIPLAVYLKYKEKDTEENTDFGQTALQTCDAVSLSLGKLSKKLLRINEKKIYKLCFYYENQRWYFPQGFQPNTFLGGYLIRKACFFGCTWPWIGRPEQLRTQRQVAVG